MKKRILILASTFMLTSFTYALPLKAPKVPKGVIEQLYLDSSFNQKRKIRDIQYKFHQDIRKQMDKYHNISDKLHFEKDLLMLDLEEARIQKDQNKIQTLYNSITQKEIQIQQNKNDERNAKYNLETKMIAEINKILGIQ